MNDAQKNDLDEYGRYYRESCDGCNRDIARSEPERLTFIVGACGGRRVLEVSCLTGGVTRALLESGAEVTALDASPKFCRETAEHCKAWIVAGKLKIAEGLFERFEPGGRFDTVLMAELLEHVIDPVGLLQKALSMADRVVVTIPWRAYFDSPEHLREFHSLSEIEWILGVENGLRWRVQSIHDAAGVASNLGIELWRKA